MPAYFAYYCVSTQKQGASGLGLEAQQAAVASFLKGDPPQGEYVEIESGKKNQRTQLLAALTAARAAGGVLRIAKLDRLSRNVIFIMMLRDSGVDFVCCDMPTRTPLPWACSPCSPSTSARPFPIELKTRSRPRKRGGLNWVHPPT